MARVDRSGARDVPFRFQVSVLQMPQNRSRSHRCLMGSRSQVFGVRFRIECPEAAADSAGRTSLVVSQVQR